MGRGVSSPAQLGPASPLLADNIDPTTHDFVSLETGMDPIEAQVLIALKIAKGTGATVQSVGNDLHKLRKITPEVEAIVLTVIRQALKRLIDQQDIRLMGVSVEGLDSAQMVAILVRWVNMRALDGQVRTTHVPLQEAS
jgi:hypothetical protein